MRTRPTLRGPAASGAGIEHSRDLGVYVGGADVTIDATVVRHTLPEAGGEVGQGISVQGELANGAANVTIHHVLLDDNRDRGVVVFGSNVLIESTVVRREGGNVEQRAESRGSE